MHLIATYCPQCFGVTIDNALWRIDSKEFATLNKCYAVTLYGFVHIGSGNNDTQFEIFL